MIYSRSGFAIRICITLLGGFFAAGRMTAQSDPTAPRVEQPKAETLATDSSATSAAVLSSGSFELGNSASGPWGVIYTLNGTYAEYRDYLLVTIDSGKATQGHKLPSDPILHSLTLGVCSQVSAEGPWTMVTKQDSDTTIPLNDIPLKYGNPYAFQRLTLRIPLPQRLPSPHWLCGDLSEPRTTIIERKPVARTVHVTVSGGNSYPAHDLGRRPDKLELTSIELAGSEAMDCGRVRLHSDPKAATDCALKVFSEKKPFRVRYDLLGMDSAVAIGIVGTPDGRLYEIHFDSDAMGRGLLFGAQRVQTVLCPEPAVLVPSRHLKFPIASPLTCFVREMQEQPARVPPSERLQNQDLIKMAKAGVDDAHIIAKIRSSKCQFDTSSDALARLKESGVSAAVIKAMVGIP